MRLTLLARLAPIEVLEDDAEAEEGAVDALILEFVAFPVPMKSASPQTTTPSSTMVPRN